MGCASGRVAPKEAKLPSVKNLQTAWDDQLLSVVSTRDSHRGGKKKHENKLSKARQSIPKPQLGTNRVTRFESPPQECVRRVVSTPECGDKTKQEEELSKARPSMPEPKLRTNRKVRFQLPPQECVTCTESERTVTVFDWDGVLYPSTWVQERLGKDFTVEQAATIRPSIQSDFSTLSSRLVTLLTTAQELGQVVIIKSSRPCGAGTCSEKLMPEAIAFMNKIPVFYASDYVRLDRLGEGDLARQEALIEAKARAVTVAVSTVDARRTSEHSKKIVCIGPGPAERDAIKELAKEGWPHAADVQQCTMKIVKVPQKLSLDLALLQVSLLSKMLGRIVHQNGRSEFDLS